MTGESRKTRKKNLCQRHIFHNKSHMKWPWFVPWRPPWQTREISISTVGLCKENQTQVLYTTHQAWWLLNRDRDPKILYIKQSVQLAQALRLVHSRSLAQILLMTQHTSLAQILLMAQHISLAQILLMTQHISLAQILLMTQHISLVQTAHRWFQNGVRNFVGA